jgi:LPS-assembly protein
MHAQQEPAQALPPTTLPNAPAPQLPRATPLAPEKSPDIVAWDCDLQSRHGDLYLLSGDVVITYRDHTLHADTVTYNQATGDVEATGHLRLSGGANSEFITATHGTYNLNTQTGRFYDVDGSIGLTSATARTASTTAGTFSAPQRTASYQNGNPFLFHGRMVVKTGPESYILYNGSVTSCLLPHPDWQLFARRFTIDNGTARAASSTFTLLGVPVLFLPYVSHPTNDDQRQSGLLIPTLSQSTTKGFIVGEQLYFTLGRSADVTVGSDYYSLRGFAESGTFRYRGPGDDFFTAHFTALQDRGYTTTQLALDAHGNVITEPLYVNQGGQDATSAFRDQLTAHTRVVGDAEYLSSYVYREAFTENFNQAVSSDITSILYVAHQNDGISLDARADRYEGLKVVPIGTTPGEEVKIFHAPSLDFDGIDRRLGNSPFLFSASASVAGLKRVQPNFATSGIIERVDLRPELSLPLAFAGWHTLSSIAVRESAYSRSRRVPYNIITGFNGPNATPFELTTPVNRSDLEVNVDIRPPVVERTFTVPRSLQRIFGDQVRHTIEPDIAYREVKGVDNFLLLLRFDETDLVSDTDELKYGVTQHLYFRPHPKPQKPKPGCPDTSESRHPELSEGSLNSADVSSEIDPTTSDLPDVLNPTPQATNDANGIPNASATAPDAPTRTHTPHRGASADPCADNTPAPQREWFSWQLAQKHFFAENFGGAVINNRRNIFTTTLDLSGIAFLTEARSTSPLISRMRFRTSSHTDAEWDFDYDTGASKFTSSNILLDAHEGRLFGGFSYARLNAPGRFHTEVINTVTNVATGISTSALSDFSQMRVLLGYGNSNGPGLSLAGSAGIDLNLGSAQYITLQSSYNWNCCGLTLEYRKYELGSVRDESAYRFNFTLANIGTAGNLRRSEKLF